MVANAGTARVGPFLDGMYIHLIKRMLFSNPASAKIEDWDTIMSVNARGTFLCYQYAAKQMVKQGRGGRIIGASSVAGKQGMFMYMYNQPALSCMPTSRVPDHVMLQCKQVRDPRINTVSRFALPSNLLYRRYV